MIYPGDTESSGPGSYFGDSSEEFDPSRKSSNNLANFRPPPADQFGSPAGDESRKGSRSAPGARHPDTDERYRKGSAGFGAEDDWSPYGGNRSDDYRYFMFCLLFL